MTRLLRAFYLCYLSQPKGLRPLYRTLRKRAKVGRKNPGGPIRKITELGVGTAERTLRILELCPAADETQYAGIDLFEGRPQGQKGLTLKQAFAEIRAPEVKVQLIPGSPYDALLRCSSTLSETDLIILSADQQPAEFEKAWKFIARTVHDKTMILREQPAGPGKTIYQTLPVAEVHRLARESGRFVRRAA